MDPNLLGQSIKMRRNALKMSQSELAFFTSVSLPTVQNLEAGRAKNPTVEVITRIGQVLGLALNISSPAPDWDFLVASGVPLLAKKQSKHSWDPQRLARELTLACAETGSQAESRESKALLAYIDALMSHYGSFVRKYGFDHLRPLVNKNPQCHTGEHLKLRRIALAHLQKYI